MTHCSIYLKVDVMNEVAVELIVIVREDVVDYAKRSIRCIGGSTLRPQQHAKNEDEGHDRPA